MKGWRRLLSALADSTPVFSEPVVVTVRTPHKTYVEQFSSSGEWEIEMDEQELYIKGFWARVLLLRAITAYDAAKLPATDEIRGSLISAAMYLAPFKEPPEDLSNVVPVEGPEDWFGVL